MKKLLLLLVMMLLPVMASAYDAYIGGIYYNLDVITKTAVVTNYNYNDNSNAYSGNIIIPSTVEYNGQTYSVTSIGEWAFESCINLISITIPNSVTSIGEIAFSNCRSLVSVTFGNGLKSIGRNAFQSCSSLVSITIPNSVTNIGERAFWGCNSITILNIPNSVISIGNEAFMSCNSLTSVTIPNSVTSIGRSAFEGCSGLTTITIPNSVTSIEGGTFAGCSGLVSITIPNSVTCIKDGEICGHHDLVSLFKGAFYGCSSLTTITIPNSVTYLGDGAFYGCSGLTTITIPNSVLTIGNGTFDSCIGLTSINIPNNVTSIGKGAFYNCRGLTSFTIPNSVTQLGDRAFENCSSLTSINIPNCITTIGYKLFYNCSALVSVTIPDGVSSIGVSAFFGCSSLTTITIPNSVNKIEEYAFANCSKIETLKLSNKLKIIRKEAFKGCNSMKNVTIPASVEFIYQEAFANCDALESVKAKPGTPPFLYDNSFSNFSVPLEVPKGCKEEYQAAQGWKNFTNISESDKGYYKLFYLVDNEEYKTYKIEEGTTITPEAEPTKEGYTFSGWSEIPETMPAHDVTVTGTFSINKYKLTYVVDGQTYKEYDVEYGAAITPEPAPTKEGYTFSGWSEIPATMPAHDVTVAGSFSINKYTLTYTVDGEKYKSYEVEYGATITSEAEPTKEGYTFSGWSEIPKTMPAHDVTVTGTFSINKYKLTYTVDGEEYKSYEVEYGANITPKAEPTKEGYTFSGWSEIPETMPAHDVTVAGSFSINKYTLTYTVDGEKYKSYEVEYGTTITPEAAPIKEGYTFSGWSEIPETMPAKDVTVNGTFTINKYKLTYNVDGKEYKSYEVEYGATITPEAEPMKEGYTFSGWSEIPSTMPPYDVTVTGSFNINSYKLTYMIDEKVYKETMYEYGATIIPEPQPEGDYDTFEWTDLPQIMPAHDVVVYASYTSGIIEVLMASQHNLRIYSPNGKKLNKLQKGLNIVILDDGTVKKYIVK